MPKRHCPTEDLLWLRPGRMLGCPLLQKRAQIISSVGARERAVTANIRNIRARVTVNFVNFPSGNFQQPDRSSLSATLLLR